MTPNQIPSTQTDPIPSNGEVFMALLKNKDNVGPPGYLDRMVIRIGVGLLFGCFILLFLISANISNALTAMGRI